MKNYTSKKEYDEQEYKNIENERMEKEKTVG